METGIGGVEALEYRINPCVSNDDLNAVFAASWPGHEPVNFGPVHERSLAYLCAFAGERLVGYVNLAWDGGIHAFLLDTTVHREFQRQGIGTELVFRAIQVARNRGMEWVHVDFDPHLREFYAGCGFQPTDAGLVRCR